MSMFKRRERNKQINRTKATAAQLRRRQALFDLLEPRTLFTVLAAPTGVTATSPSISEIDLSWTNETGNTGYLVQESATPTGTFTTIATLGTNVTTDAVTSVPSGSTTVGLTAATSYSFRIEAINASGDSAPSTVLTAPTVTVAPTLTTAPGSATSVTLNWTAITGATSYVLSRSTDLNTWTTVSTLTTVSPATTPPVTYTNTGLTSGTTYYYRLTAVDASGSSAFSPVATVLASPTGLTLTSPSAGEVDLSWNDESGNSGYLVQAQTGTGSTLAWSTVATVPTDTTSYAVTSLPGTGSTTTPLAAGTSYSFRIVTLDGSADSLTSSTQSATTIPAAPALTTAVNSTTSVTLNWTAVTGASSYILTRSTDLSTWTPVTTLNPVGSATTPPVTYTDTTLSANTTYYYRLQAADASGNSDYSLIASVTTLLAAPTGVTATALSTSQVAVSWPSEAGAYGYSLQQQTGSTWANVSGAGSLSSSTNLFVVNNLATNTAYNFRLIANNTSGLSAPTAAIAVTTLANAPALTSTAASTTAITLNWGAITGATGYVVQESTDDATWSTINSPTASTLTYSATGLTADTLYFFRLAVTNAGGNSAWSPVDSQMTSIAANSNFTVASASSYSNLASWTSQPTASGFKLQVQSGSGSSATWTQVGDLIPGSATSYTISGLSPNTAYTYRLITENAAGDSAPTATVASTTRLARPRVTGLAGSDTSVVLNWANITGNTGYLVEASTDDSTWTVVTTTAANVVTSTVSSIPTTPSATPLVADTAYYFRVQATNANGNSSPSNVLTQTTLVVAPASLAVSNNATTSLTLGWTDSTGNDGYVVQKEIHSTWVTLATLATSTDTYVINGLHAGNTYNFQVLAVDGGGFSLPSAISGTTLPKSTVVTAVGATTTSIALTWPAIPGVTRYNVESSPDNISSSTWTSIATPTAGTTTYTDASISAANTVQYYKVQGVDAGGNGAFSSIVSAYSLDATPTTFAATSLSDTQVSLSWDAETSATYFRLEKQVTTTTGTGSSAVTTTTWPQVGGLIPGSATSYIIPNLTANTAYTFRLLAVNDGGGDSIPSATQTVTTKVPAPVVTLGTATSTTVPLSWPAVASATGYKVLRSTTPNDGFTQIGTVSIPTPALTTYTYTDSTAVQGTLYYYEVTASNAGGDSLPSNVATLTTLMTAPAQPTAVASETTSIDLGWTAVAGATGYIVQQQGTTTTGTGSTAVTTTTWTAVGGTQGAQADSLNVASLTSGTAYTFRLIAVDAAGNSLPSPTVTTSTLLAAPVATAVAATATSTTVTWPTVTGATSYVVQRSVDSGTWATVNSPTAVTGTTQTYTDTGLTAGTEYFYRVQAVNAGGNSQFSPVVSTTTLLAAPTSVTATSTSSSQITLAWAAQPTAAGFIVQQLGGTVSTPTWTQVGDQIESGATGTVIAGLTANTAFTYRVIAVDDGGSSLPSSSVSATTSTTVTKVKATPLSDTVISLGWTAVTGATGYKIYSEAAGGSAFALLTSVGSTTTGYTATGLTANTGYAFYVTATGAGAESAPSNTVNTSTLLSPPAGLAITADSTNPNTSLDFAWTQSTGNNGYLIQKLVGTIWTTVGTTAVGTNAYVATGLFPNVSYTFRISAINASGVSLPGASASFATA
jgi:large repetitive protein